MKIYSVDNSELMEISRVDRKGNDLVLHGKIMGALPMKAIIRPRQARVGLSLITGRIFLFLLTFLFRK
jgi:hypothetical protein